MDWVAIVQQLDRDLLAIEMTRSAFSLQENKVRSISLFDRDTAAPISKTDFKELGAAEFIIGQVGVEALIGLIANSIEMFSVRLKRHLNIDWEPFKNPLNHIRFAERARQFRALNNVFKHQEGYIEAASSRSAQFLVDGGYFKDKTYLKHLSVDSIVANFELALYETFAHLYEICFHVTNLPDDLRGKMNAQLFQALKDRVIYSVIKPSLIRNES